MLKDFLRDVVILVAVKKAEEIADLIHNPKHKNEFIIAKKMDLTIKFKSLKLNIKSHVHDEF